MKEINILSVGSRSLWLSNALCRQGFKVKLYLVEKNLDHLRPEDSDGPFLIPNDYNFDPVFKSFFKDQEDLRPLDQGFCLSCPSGNISYSMDNFEAVKEKFKSDFYKEASSEASFWLDDFMASFGKVRFKKSDEWRGDSLVFDPKRSFSLRSSKEEHYQKKIETLKQRGVDCISVGPFEVSKILEDIKQEYKKWVVDLTITELKVYTGVFVENLDMQLGWQRKRFALTSLEDKKKLASFPVWSVWIHSYYKTWKEDNYYIIIKGKSGNYIDIWSIEQIYNQELKQEAIENAKDFLEKNLSFVKFNFEEAPGQSSSLQTLFPVSTGYSEINDTRYLWNSPREWMSYNEDVIHLYQNEFVKWLNHNNMGRSSTHDLTI